MLPLSLCSKSCERGFELEVATNGKLCCKIYRLSSPVYIVLTNFEYSIMVLAKAGGIIKVLESSVDCYLPAGYGVKPMLRSLG